MSRSVYRESLNFLHCFECGKLTARVEFQGFRGKRLAKLGQGLNSVMQYPAGARLIGTGEGASNAFEARGMANTAGR